MKDPTAVTLRRQSGANLLIVGQRDEVALNLMAGALVGLAAQLPRRSAQFVILDGTPPDSIPRTPACWHVWPPCSPTPAGWFPGASVPEVIAELAQEAQKTRAAEPKQA